MTWPVETLLGANGTDLSWMGGLHLAVQRRLQFGPDFVFTYGPLGFLQIPQPYYGWTSVAALAYLLVIQIGICAYVLRAARRNLPWPLAIVLAYVAVRSVSWLGAGADQWHGVPEMSLLLVFLMCGDALVHQSSSGTCRFAIAAGAIAGVLILGKFNVGVASSVILCLTVLGRGRPWRRSLAEFMVGAAVTTMIIWLVLGQGPGNLMTFFVASLQIAAGYSAAMGVTVDPSLAWQYGAALIGATTVAILAVEAARGVARRRSLVFLLTVATLAFATFKVGFVRWHTDLVFGTAVLAAFGVMSVSRRSVTTILPTLGLIVGLLAAAHVDPVTYLKPTQSLRAVVDQVATILSPASRAGAYARTVSTTRAAYQIDAETLALIVGHTVHFDPIESAIAIGYPELDWRPLPVFQDFSVYTHGLDQGNADYLASARAPERILRERPYAIDGRNPWWEGPAATLEMVCRYRELRAYERWEVLARGPDRCGAAESLGTLRTTTGTAIRIPLDRTDGGLLVVRVIGLDSDLLTRAQTILDRGPEWSATADSAVYRLVAGTAMDGLIVSAPASLGYSPDFAFGPPIASLTIQGPPGAPYRPADLMIEFVRYPVDGS